MANGDTAARHPCAGQRRQGTVNNMRSHRAFTLIELIVTIVLIAVVAAIAGTAATTMFDKLRDRNARDTLRVIAAAEERFYEQRGRFTDTNTELATLDGSYTYVSGSSDSVDDKVSVSVSASGEAVGLALRSKSGACFLLRVESPNSGENDATAEIAAIDVVCAGSVALDQVGQEW